MELQGVADLTLPQRPVVGAFRQIELAVEASTAHETCKILIVFDDFLLARAHTYAEAHALVPEKTLVLHHRLVGFFPESTTQATHRRKEIWMV